MPKLRELGSDEAKGFSFARIWVSSAEPLGQGDHLWIYLLM
jgi:hypothetical protein